MVDKEIEERTRNCVRMQKMTVTTVYSDSTDTIGVSAPFDTEVQLPVWGDMDAHGLAVGDTVWVLYPYSDFSNAIVFMAGSGQTWGPVGTGWTISAIDQTLVFTPPA